jgi:hypothetical protein
VLWGQVTGVWGAGDGCLGANRMGTIESLIPGRLFFSIVLVVK